MNDSIRILLEAEIKAEINDLSALDSGSDEKSRAIDDLVNLYKLKIEESKLELDAEEKRNRRIDEIEARDREEEFRHDKFIAETEAREREEEFKRSQLAAEMEARDREEQLKRSQFEEQIKDRYFKWGVEVAGIVLPLVFYACWMAKGFKFEETGTYTSTTFRGLFSRFKPIK